MFLKLIALAAVGGAAWLFMRPQIPILPPGIISKKRKSVNTETALEVKQAGLTKGAEPSQVSAGCSEVPKKLSSMLTQTYDKDNCPRMDSHLCSERFTLRIALE